MRSIALSLCVLVCGCANQNTVYREVGGSPKAGRSVVLDAAQRAVISVDRTVKSGATVTHSTVVCPEPFPDAIAAFFASGAATASLVGTDGATKQLQAAIASGSAVSSFGLRTNSTVLLSNSISSNCFAHMNGATESPGYMELQRRSQTFNLGVLAIEQLTGVVKGDQASVSGKADGKTGTTDLSGLQKAVDAAVARVDEAEKSNLTAQRTTNDKATEVNQQAAVKAAAAAKLAATAPADAAAVKTAKEDLDKQIAALAKLEGELKTLQDNQAAAQKLVDQARSDATKAQGALQAATGNVQVSGAGSGSNATNTQIATTTAVSDAVTKIVGMVLLEAGRGEGCNGIIRDFPLNPEKYQSAAGQAILIQCVEDRRLTSEALKRAIGAPNN